MRRLILNIPDISLGDMYTITGSLDGKPLRFGIPIDPTPYVNMCDNQRNEYIKEYMARIFAQIGAKVYERGF